MNKSLVTLKPHNTSYEGNTTSFKQHSKSSISYFQQCIRDIIREPITLVTDYKIFNGNNLRGIILFYRNSLRDTRYYIYAPD